MRSSLLCIVSLALMMWSAHSRAERENPWEKVPACNWSNAAPIPVSDLWHEQSAYAGTCVRVRGLLGYRELVDSLENYYALHGRRTEALPGHLRRVAVYGYPDALNNELWSVNRLWVELTGVVSHCSELTSDDPATVDEKTGLFTITMMTGTCHYFAVPALLVSQMRSLPGGTRMTGSDARARLGDLEPLRGRWSSAADATAMAERWLTALQQGNEKQFLSLHEMPDLLRGRDDAVPGWLLSGPQSISKRLSGRSAADLLHYFKLRPEDETPKSETANRQAVGDYSVAVCACHTGTCENEWPISTLDIEVDPAHPYVCARIMRSGGKTRVLTELARQP